jgi:ankyrin repeat protein
MIEQDDVAGVKLAVWDGFEINRIYVVDGNDSTPLLEAIKHNRPMIVKFLLESGAETESKADYMTPLLTSIMHINSWPDKPDGAKKFEIFDLLLEHNADVNSANIFGWTPLGYAAFGVNYGASLILVKKLLDAGAQPNPAIERSEWMPPLFWALTGTLAEWDKTRENRIELIETLLKSGADPNTRAGMDGDAPLHIAAAIGDGDLTKILLNAGADKGVKNLRGDTPLDVAIAHANLEAIKILTRLN